MWDTSRPQMKFMACTYNLEVGGRNKGGAPLTPGALLAPLYYNLRSFGKVFSEILTLKKMSNRGILGSTAIARMPACNSKSTSPIWITKPYS